ncbi:MAG: pyridoxamine 5'-phosphate oxidase family protein [Desulfobacterales bacterium]|nr:pyridoxamine 5'-phosphate oxidase family protein [Desulfobacterales bacterium]
MEKEELKKAVLEYLQHHHTVSLATESGGSPHAATVFYVSIGFDLYFLSSPTSRHGENLSQNPKVSATINEDHDKWQKIQGIQLEGRVENVGGILDNSRIARAFVKKYPDVADFLFSPRKLGQAIAQKVAGVRFYKIKPDRIFFISNAVDFGKREELTFSD